MKKLLWTLMACLCMWGSAMAQAPSDPGDNPDTEETPIDGGIAILVIAGVYYGVQKIRKTTAINISKQ